ncbi:MAG: glutamate synthase-related protein, partial [Candidatus Latescibacterota bacterium]
ASFEQDLAALPEVRMVELELSDEVMDRASRVKDRLGEGVVAIRVPINREAEGVVARLVGQGAEVIHLCADRNGNEHEGAHPGFVKDRVRAIHLHLIETAVRDQVTLMISGGIALPEHVAKTIVCGADLTAVDLPLLVALECRLCRRCEESLPCPVKLEAVDESWAQQRIVNLMGAWHSQLIELMGAMGIREVRRLRGETGRAMFFEDMEKDSFGPLFGERIAGERSCETGWERESSPPAHTPAPFSGNGVLVRTAPPRFRNPIGKYKVRRNAALCVHCGKCAEVCPTGVHARRKGFERMSRPVEYRCAGLSCSKCIDQCPQHALSLAINPLYETMGDARWTADLILSTWAQAETGQVPVGDLETRIGNSGGGFDRMRISFPQGMPVSAEGEAISTRIDLNKRGEGQPEVSIGLPIYGGGMSFGSVGPSVMEAKARVAQAFDTFTCTGEGGYPDLLLPYANHVITQVATGLFGVREETIGRARIVEFKYAQGAKPGLGGHLLGDKNTADVARMREAVMGSSLFSPFPFHSVYSVEDHKKHVDWIKAINPKALVSVKVSTPTDVDMVAVGSFYAGAHIIHLDGSYGGTGAAPDIAKKNIAMPIEYAIPKVHRFLEAEGIRDKVTLIASGGLRTAYDVAKAIAMGADGVVIGTAEMVALGCIRCTNCESGRGCARGIATTDSQLATMIDVEWAAQRLINLYASWQSQLRDILRSFGMRCIQELRGRSDCLVHLDYEDPSASAEVG